MNTTTRKSTHAASPIAMALLLATEAAHASGSAYIFTTGKPMCTAQGACICKLGYGGADCGQKLN